MTNEVLAFSLAVANVLCFFFFISLRPYGDSADSRRLGIVTSFLIAALIQIAIAFGQFLMRRESGMMAPLWAFVSWTVGVSLILWFSTIPRTLKGLMFPFLVLGPVVMAFHPDGLSGFSASLDAFTASVTSPTAPAHDATPEASDAGPPSETSAQEDGSEARLTASGLFRGLIAFIHTFLVASCYGGALKNVYEKHSVDERGPVFQSGALQQLVYLLSVCVGLLVAFVSAGGNGVGLGVFSGFVAVALSVALHDMLKNFVAGLIMLWEKSIRVGEVISLGETGYGQVKSITMRYMVVQDRDDITTMIPHSQLINSQIENWTRARTVRLKLDIGVAYGSDLAKVKEIMKSVHLKVERVLSDPPPKPTIMGTDESSIHMQLRFRIEDPHSGIRNVMSQVYEVLLKRFHEEGIEIPFPQRVVHHRGSDQSQKLPPIRIQLERADRSEGDKS